MSKEKLGKEARFAKALKSGKTISRKQATTQYKLGNPSATVARLEETGMRINRQTTTNRDGLRVVKYSVR